MFYLIAYVLFILLELAIAVSFVVYFATLIYSSLKGAPYVPTKNQELDRFLKEAKLKKNSVFLELGSGDGRVVRTAVRDYGVKGIGIDVSPVLTFWARWKARRENLSNIEFESANIITSEHPKADYIYLFLFPALIEKIKPKLKKQIRNGSTVISHGFKVKGWEEYMYKTIESRPFNTYYYRNRKSR